MAKKIQITRKKAEQFNQMLSALRCIHLDYHTPGQIRRDCYGVDADEAIEMAYENIQYTAKVNSKGISPIKLEPLPSTNESEAKP